MRMFIGIIVGSALTFGGLYIADSVASGDSARPMVNWDVMAKKPQRRCDDGQGRLEKDRGLNRLLHGQPPFDLSICGQAASAAAAIPETQARTSWRWKIT